MTGEELRRGTGIAREAVLWAIFSGCADTMRAGELRDHIRALFGSEVDAALDREFARATESEPGEQK